MLKVANVTNSFIAALPPSVVFSILELYQRRLEDQTRVIGLLLGSWSDDGMQVSIEECFPIPLVDLVSSESGNLEFEIEFENQKTIVSKAFPSLGIVGWYGCGYAPTISKAENEKKAVIDSESRKLFYNDEKLAEIHESMTGYIGGSQLHHPSLFVSVDPLNIADPDDNYGITGWTHAPIGIYEPGLIFSPIQVTMKIDLFENPILHLVAKGKKISGPMDLLADSLAKLEDLLKRLSDYVDSAAAGKIDPDSTVIRKIWDSLAILPSYESIERAIKLNEPKTKEVYMVSQITDLIKRQLSLSETLQKTLSA